MWCLKFYVIPTSSICYEGSSWSSSYDSCIYSYLCNQCLSPLTLWGRIPLRRGAVDTTLCDKVCQWLVAGLWFSPGTPVSSTNKTDRLDITEILLTVALNTTTLTPQLPSICHEVCILKLALLNLFS
jgi:hypothetical protein